MSSLEMENSSQSIARPLGDYLDCPREAIDALIASQAGPMARGKRLGEVLLEGRLVSAEALHRGLRAQRVDRLRGCPLFADFDRRELQKVSAVFHECTYEADHQFINQGQQDEKLYVLASGELEVWRETESGQRIALGFAAPGEPVGEIAYVSGGIRSASVKTLTRCHLLVACFGELKILLDEVPKLTHALMSIVTRRVMNTTLRFEDQTRRLHKVEHSLEQLHAFLDLSDTTDVGVGIEQLLQRLVTTASDLTDADRATLFLRDDQTGELWSKIAEGEKTGELRVPRGHGVAGWVAENRELANIGDAYGDARFTADVDRRTGYRTRSILCTPIWGLAGQILGVVQVVNKHTGEFTGDDESLIRAFAHQAAVAVENFELYSRVLASHRQIGVLLELSATVTQTLDMPTLINRVVSRTAQALQCDRSSFWVMDEEAGELWSMDSSGGEMQEVRIPADSGLAGYAASHRETVRVADAYRDPRFNREVDRLTGYRTRDVLCVPVVNREGRVTGVTQCINKLAGCFDDEDVRLGEGIATHIAIALDNSQLHSRALEMHSYLENVQGSIASGIVSLDESANIVTANRAALKLLPSLNDLDLERSIERILGRANPGLMALIWEALARKQRGARESLSLMDQSRAHGLTVNAEVVPLTDGDGQFKGLVLVLEDVTNERRIRSAFGQYLAPAVIDQLMADPGRLRLGGEKRDITAMFTDIQDFTRLSEAVDPGALVRLLNEYFDGACEIVLRYGGTIDKFALRFVRYCF